MLTEANKWLHSSKERDFFIHTSRGKLNFSEASIIHVSLVLHSKQSCFWKVKQLFKAEDVIRLWNPCRVQCTRVVAQVKLATTIVTVFKKSTKTVTAKTDRFVRMTKNLLTKLQAHGCKQSKG